MFRRRTACGELPHQVPLLITLQTQQIQPSILAFKGINILSTFGAESFVFQIVIRKYNIKVYRTVVLYVILDGCET